MRLSLLALLPFVADVHAQWKACSQWWPDIKPGKAYTVNAKCHLFPDYPQKFGSTKVTVVYTKNWAKHHVSKIKNMAPVLEKSLDKSIDYYSTLAKLPAHIVVILTDGVDGTTTADTYYPHAKKPPCQIRGYHRFTTEAAGSNEARALQALSHELWHCVSSLKMGNTKEPSWVIEGSANYFSNRVFPSSNVEWPGPDRHYNPDLPIYAQVKNDVYTTSLFFQALERTRGPEYLADWVLATPSNPNKAERNRLSGLTDFIDDFYTFSKQLSLRHIRDTSGVLIEGLPKFDPEPATLRFSKEETVGTTILKVVPFAVTVFKLSVKPGQTISLSSAAQEGWQRLAYRTLDDDTWTAMPDNPSSGRGQISLACNKKGTKATILVLFVSTADLQNDYVTVTVKRDRLEQCSKVSDGGFILYPLYNPKTAGAKCPTGTHFAKAVAWCCPDGMELDEHVQSEVSICCPTCGYCVLLTMNQD